MQGALVVVGDDDPARPPGIRHGVGALPWAGGGARAVTAGDVMVIGDVAPGRMAQVAGRVRALLPDVVRVWTLQRPPQDADLYRNGRVVVEAVADPAFQAEWFGPSPGTAGSRVIFYPGSRAGGSSTLDDLGFSAAAPRLLVGTGLLARLGSRDAATRAAVDAELRFQLARLGRWRHDMSGGVLPAWMDSGAGDYTAYRGPGARVSAARAAAAYQLPPATVRAIRAGTWDPAAAGRRTHGPAGCGHRPAGPLHRGQHDPGLNAGRALPSHVAEKVVPDDGPPTLAEHHGMLLRWAR